MVLIKRYPNRKLYNTCTKQYITLEGIAELIRQGSEVQVIDNAGGEDLTALTLTQIILEQEKHKSGLLSNSFLTNLIRTSEDRLSALQRSLFSPGALLKQFDEEIQKRIHDLVSQGEMTAPEGDSIIQKLIHQGRRLGDPDRLAADRQTVENVLRQRQIPTQADLQRLYDQIDELTNRLDDLSISGRPTPNQTAE